LRLVARPSPRGDTYVVIEATITKKTAGEPGKVRRDRRSAEVVWCRSKAAVSRRIREFKQVTANARRKSASRAARQDEERKPSRGVSGLLDLLVVAGVLWN
jgi:hypothetical protein